MRTAHQVVLVQAIGHAIGLPQHLRGDSWELTTAAGCSGNRSPQRGEPRLVGRSKVCARSAEGRLRGRHTSWISFESSIMSDNSSCSFSMESISNVFFACQQQGGGFQEVARTTRPPTSCLMTDGKVTRRGRAFFMVLTVSFMPFTIILVLSILSSAI